MWRIYNPSATATKKTPISDTAKNFKTLQETTNERLSPEQIQHRLRHEGSPHAISYATIYRGIYAGRFNDPDWVKSGKQRLRHRGKKRLRKGAAARGGGGGAGGKNILSAAVSAVATRDEREHQRPATGILPETSGYCAVF